VLSLQSLVGLRILQLAWTFLLLPALVWGQSNRMTIAQSYLQQGRVDEARKIFLELLRENPNHQGIHATLGQIAFSRQEFRQAIEHFRKAETVMAGNPLMRVNLAEALFETAAAELAKLELAKLAATATIAQFEAGLLLARHGDFLTAEQHFLKAKPSYPNFQVISYNLALAQYSAGKFLECSRTLEDARQKGARTAEIMNLLGESYSESGKTAEATKILKEAVSFYPKDERNYVSLARVLIEEDEPTEGFEIVDKGLGLLPKSAALLLQRAYLLMSLGRNREAESDYRRVAEIDKNSAAARIGLAFSLIQSQRQAEATTLLEELASSERQNYFPYYLLGELYLRQGLEDRAISTLKQAAYLQPAVAAIHSSLGKLHLKKNDLDLAVKELEKATRLDSSDTTGFYQLSIAYRKSGQPDRAREALAQVRRLNEIERQLGTSRFLTRKLKSLRDNFSVSPN